MKRLLTELKNAGRHILLFAIVPLIGLILISGVTGLTMDVVMGPWIVQLALSSIEDLSELTKAPYRKPDLYPDMVEGNAWDSYSEIASASEKLRDVSIFLYHFWEGKEQDTTRAELELKEYDSLFRFLKEGVHRKVCRVPVDYQKGVDAYSAFDLTSRKMGRLLTTRSRIEVDRNPGSALEDMIDGIVFGQDIAGGDLTLEGYWNGIWCESYCIREISNVLRDFRFKAPELQMVAWSMSVLANAQPSPLRDLDVYRCRTAISLAKLPLFQVLTLHEVEGEYQKNRRIVRCGVWWLVHLLSWRTLFSFKWSQFCGIRLQHEMTKELTIADACGYAAVDSVAASWKTRIETATRRINPLTISWEELTPGLRDMPRYHCIRIAEMRMAGAAALVELHFLERKDWPDSLSSVNVDAMADLLIDSFTEKPLTYLIYPGRDSVGIYSVGPNMVVDGDIEDECRDDLLIVLHRPAWNK